MDQRRVLEVNVDDIGNGGVYALVKSAIENNHEAIKFDIATLEKFDKSENISELNNYNCEVKYIGYEGNKLLKQIHIYRNLCHLLKNEKYDFIHIHADVANKLLVSGLAAKHSGTANIILHSHAAGIDGNHRRIKYIVHRLCRPFLKRIGTKFVSCSYVAANWMFPNINKNDIVIVHNGVDCEKFKFNKNVREYTRRKLGVGEKLLIGHVGRFSYQKNHTYILKIAARMKGKGLKAKFLLVGEGPQRKEIAKLAQKRGLEDWIIFTGLTDSVNELYSAMDVFILPSHFEGLPLVGVEAQAAGLPCIFSNRVTREVKLTKNVCFCGIKDSDIDEWISIIESYANITRIDGSKAVKAKQYSVEDVVQGFMQLYET